MQESPFFGNILPALPIIFQLFKVALESNISSKIIMQCFITKWNTGKRVKNTMHSRLFLMYFDQNLSHLVIRHITSNAWYYFSNKMILEGEIKDVNISWFSSDF